MGDRRLKVTEIASEIGIFWGSATDILCQHLDLRKVCARWVPRLLTPIQKSFRVETSPELLALNNTNADDVLSRTVTGDETWIHHWDLNIEQESMQWKLVHSPPRSFTLNRWQEKSWQQFSGTVKVCCWWTTSHRRLQ